MCTVTIVPTFDRADAPSGIRVLCNRDESRVRPAAQPPIEKTFGKQLAVMPIDRVSGGTWIAVNDAGLMITLLNGNPRDMRDVTFTGKTSRGVIIPSLLHAGSLAEAGEAVRTLDVSKYPPFRMVIANTTDCLDAAGDNNDLAVQSQPITGPLMFTSSGLGDALVAAPRHELFDGWFGDDSRQWEPRQDDLHRHRWDDRPELSVNMSREDAATVSLTEVEVTAQRVALTYHPAGPGKITDPSASRFQLPRMVRP